MSSIYTVRIPGTGRNPWGQLLGAMARAILAQYLLGSPHTQPDTNRAADTAGAASARPGPRSNQPGWGLQPLSWKPPASVRPVASLAALLPPRSQPDEGDLSQYLTTPEGQRRLRQLLQSQTRALNV